MSANICTLPPTQHCPLRRATVQTGVREPGFPRKDQTSPPMRTKLRRITSKWASLLRLVMCCMMSISFLLLITRHSTIASYRVVDESVSSPSSPSTLAGADQAFPSVL